MVAAKSITESLKVSLYEVLALLFPGAFVLEALERTNTRFAFLGDASALAYAGLAYAVGLALQGLCALLGAGRLEALSSKKSENHARAERAARAKMTSMLGTQPEPPLLDFALSRVGSARAVYDKFVALRDMARGLAFAALVALFALYVADAAVVQPWHYAVVVLALAGFTQRYWAYAPLAGRLHAVRRAGDPGHRHARRRGGTRAHRRRGGLDVASKALHRNRWRRGRASRVRVDRVAVVRSTRVVDVRVGLYSPGERRARSARRRWHRVRCSSGLSPGSHSANQGVNWSVNVAGAELFRLVDDVSWRVVTPALNVTGWVSCESARVPPVKMGDGSCPETVI
jgi:hypothetical protein